MFSMILGMMAGGLPPGTPAPDVAARNQDGALVRLGELRGRPVLLYFYPKDDTPGCTKQACQLRDDYAQFQALGVVILGVSRQGAESHRAFRAKYRLPFDLLTDDDGSFAKAFGVKTVPLLGVHRRQSVLIGADGRILAFYEDVDPLKHSGEVLQTLRRAGVTAPEAPSTAP